MARISFGNLVAGFLILFSMNLSAAGSFQVLDSHWKISLGGQDLPLGSSLGMSSILNIKTKKGDILFISKDEAPESIGTIKLKIKESGGDPHTLKVIRASKEALFRFRAGDVVHWFSTRGGHLTLIAPPSMRDSAVKRVGTESHG